jgi:hypothetical protein
MATIAALVAIGWRTLAALGGVLAAGWAASALPMLLESPADAGAQPRIVSEAALVSSGAATSGRRETDWIAVPRPMTTFALGVSDLDGQDVRLTARRGAQSDAREDQLVAGEFAGPKLFASIALRRASPDDAQSHFVAMSRLAARGGLAIERSAQPLALPSKFGPIEAADMVVSEGGRTRSCLGFRHQADEIGFSFQGWLCGDDKRAADRQQLTCLIDRINLHAAGEDRALRAHFARAELNRQPSCNPPKLQATGRRTSWLDGNEAKPPLRRGG